LPKLGLRRHLSVAQIGYGTVADGRVRVIYYFHDHRTPLYLLTVFGKGEKDNLTKAERNELAELVVILKEYAGGEP
jgi:hypothetical protein